jgi:type IV pilus assembly protein PilW
MPHQESQHGFSLIEVLIAMAISLIIIAGIYQLFYTQQRSYLAQDQVVEMQQNLRAGLYLLAKDIRSAGYDPSASGRFGFVNDFTSGIFNPDINYVSDKSTIAFTMDDNEDGIVDANDNEQFSYRFNSTNNTIEKYNFAQNQWQTLSTNVDALNFIYLDRNGNVTTNRANISAVEISILVRTGKEEEHYSRTQVYQNKLGQNICSSCASTPHFRRRLLVTTVRVRNFRR